jgi:salicylate hydroxylase
LTTNKSLLEEWSSSATVDEVLEEFKGFHPRYLKFLEIAGGPFLRWQLRALPILPTWINGRTALLGDAAHATLPTLGQGAGMALEDAATLGCLIPLGTRKEDVPARLKAYYELRKPRGEFVNRESLEQAIRPERRGVYMRCEYYIFLGFFIQLCTAKEMQDLLVGYDAVQTAQQYYREHFGLVAD